jgi:tetratricopeptide (TPR) repeat protein
MELAGIANFFETPWTLVNNWMKNGTDAALFNIASTCLRAIGRNLEAVSPNEASLKIRASRKEWGNASNLSSNLTELLMSLGEIQGAMAQGLKGLDYARRSKDPIVKLIAFSTYAKTVVVTGKSKGAELMFSEAEKMRHISNPRYPHLQSLFDYHFRDLLMLKNDFASVKVRALRTLDFSIYNNWLLEIAIDNLDLGVVLHHEAKSSSNGDFSQSFIHLNESVSAFRRANRIDKLPLALLARAAIYRDMHAYEKAQPDLNEVLEIAYPEMRLHLTDYHLESARLCLAMGGKHTEAQDHYEKAKKLVDDTGYHYRDKELDGVKKILVS